MCHGLSSQSSAFWASGTGFMEDNFSLDWGRGGWVLGVIQTHYIYCALYFVAISEYSALTLGLGFMPMRIWCCWSERRLSSVSKASHGKRLYTQMKLHPLLTPAGQPRSNGMDFYRSVAQELGTRSWDALDHLDVHNHLTLSQPFKKFLLLLPFYRRGNWSLKR